ncbi:TolB family protein [Methanosarcina sp.]|uniref:TolB family protein n=1 Tax=Methanosarcina sp. TaxID=2213 RepID=UPI003BB5CBEB
MKNRFVLLLLAVLILISACGIGSALKETQLSTNKADQWNPSIWSNYVVWQDARNGGSDVYLTDMKTKVQTRITKGVDAENPMVSGTKIVWSDNRNGNCDVYMYDIKTKKTTRITTNTADQTNPACYGNLIVWEDNRNSGHDIYLQDLATKKQTRITTDGFSLDPAIYGTKIVYNNRGDGMTDVGPTVGAFMYDIKTKKVTQLSNNVYDRPVGIYDSKVLINGYYDYPYSYVHFINAYNKFVDLPSWEYTGIYSNKVVYSNNGDVYMAQF